MEAINTPTFLRPSTKLVLGLIAYLPLAFLVTLAAGDLGDIGFWFVWIPVVAILLYLPVVGLVRLTMAVKRR